MACCSKPLNANFPDPKPALPTHLFAPSLGWMNVWHMLNIIHFSICQQG